MRARNQASGQHAEKPVAGKATPPSPRDPDESVDANQTIRPVPGRSARDAPHHASESPKMPAQHAASPKCMQPTAHDASAIPEHSCAEVPPEHQCAEDGVVRVTSGEHPCADRGSPPCTPFVGRSVPSDLSGNILVHESEHSCAETSSKHTCAEDLVVNKAPGSIHVPTGCFGNQAMATQVGALPRQQIDDATLTTSGLPNSDYLPGEANSGISKSGIAPVVTTSSNDSSKEGGYYGNTNDHSVECGYNPTSSDFKEATVGDCELSCATLSVRDSPPSSEMVGPSGVRVGTNSMSHDAHSHSSIYKADLNSRLPSTAVSPISDGLDPIPTPNDGSSSTHPSASVTDVPMASPSENLIGPSQEVVTEESSSPQEPLATSIYSSPSRTSVQSLYGSTDVLSRRPEEQLLADYLIDTYGSNTPSKSTALPLEPTEPPQEPTNPIPIDSAGRIASRTTMWRPGSNGTNSVPAPRTAGDTKDYQPSVGLEHGPNQGLVDGTPPLPRR